MRRVLPSSVCAPRHSKTAARTAGWLALALLALVVCVPAGAVVKTEPVPGTTVNTWTPDGTKVVPPEAVSGQVLIQLKAGTTDAQLQAALARRQGNLLKAVPSINTYLVSLPDGTSVTQGVAAWKGENIVALAGPDLVCQFTAVPGDPLYSQQYHLPLISAPKAWDVTQGSAQVIVAVVDSGVDLDHEDLATRIWRNTADPINGIDDDGNGYVDDNVGWDAGNNDNDPKPHPADSAAYDVVTHGTHVAGIIGAAANNAMGVAGVDWTCRLMAVKVGDDAGNLSTSSIIEGFMYAVDNGADVINLSLRGGYTELWDAPISQAIAKGVVVVAAAGNDYWEFTDSQATWMSPVCNDGPFFTDNYVLGVAATDENDIKADFSNYDGSSRNFVDVAAPGVDVMSCYLNDPVAGLGQIYGPMSGTSMACPVVAGVAAMVKARFPQATPAEVLKQIRLSTDNIDAENPFYLGKLGTGRVNLHSSVIDVPPAAPKTVSAFDSPGDEGGSVTVIWSKSADDGKGFNDVVGYDVMRSLTGQDGSFATIKTNLPKGTTSYIDTNVVDLTSYWYKVRVRDAVNITESAIAGPAIPRDDLAPAPIDNLFASDTLGDDGGSVTVNWSGYKTPADFVEYRVYRSEKAFTALGEDGVTEIATIDQATEQVYVDQSVIDGTQYWYAVGVVDDFDNENAQVLVAGPVVPSPNFTFNYPVGLSMVAIGAETPEKDLAKLLGIDAVDLKAARYDPAQGAYRKYADNPADPFLRHALGRAFWVSAPAALVRSIAGEETTDDPFSIAIVPGWQMIGNPFTTAADIEFATVTVNGDTVSLRVAAQRGWVRDYMWAYDAFLRSYTLLSPSIDWASTIISKGRGVFFRSFVTGTLNLPRQGAAAPAGAVEEKLAGADWKIRLVAETASGADVDNFVGVSSAAASLNALSSPPPQGVDLYFDGDGAVRPAAKFTEPGGAIDCTVNVRTESAGTVVLRWPDLSGMPADYRPVLVDTQSGKKTYLRTATSYEFEAEAGGVRSFDLKLAPATGTALVVRSMAAAPSGSGAQVVFTLSQDASVTAEVLNIAGRRVRTLATVEANGGELTTLSWDGRGDYAPVPAGRYLVRVTATTQDGQTASAVTALSIGR